MTTVSAVRMPGSTVEAARALRRNTAEQMRSSADAVTWMLIRTFRARLGPASFVTSPRTALTSSTRVACSAGASPKKTVERIAPARRNAITRQSAATAPIRTFSAISGAMVLLTA
jgi:hypothetical protein